MMESFVNAISKKTGRRYPKALWRLARPKDGDYPVYRDKLRRVIGPCLTHMLDAAFAGFVVEELKRRGVGHLVSIHDCWIVPLDAERVLTDAIAAAGRPWLEALGSVYDDFERLLGYCTPRRRRGCCGVCGRWVQELHQKWADRVAHADWPRFRVGDVSLVARRFN
jgi:hypothetical protein